MEEKYISIGILTKYIKKKFDIDPYLQKIWVKGEISNITIHRSGHLYFTLKDEQARISAVMFNSSYKNIDFKPEEGMKVLIQGSIAIFEKTGSYQLYVRSMEQDGKGNLFLAYQKIKDKLEKEGLFDSDKKKEIPKFPRNIGVITSPTGAAIQDILTTLKRRYPIAKVTIFPAIVQGENATKSIVKSLKNADGRSDLDVIILGRGGGSIEELWAFNEEVVARAIYTCKIPIISAVGHETDFTIADFVADLRAPTPTGAAEIATPNINDIISFIHSSDMRLTHAINRYIKINTEKLERVKSSYIFQNPQRLYEQKILSLDILNEKLMDRFNLIVERKNNDYLKILQGLKKQRLIELLGSEKSKHQTLIDRQNRAIDKVVKIKGLSFQNLIGKLDALSPIKVMERGYGIIASENGEVITTINKIQIGESINLTMNDGSVDCTVKNILKKGEQ
ncbi:MAG: exodeoxyribonuclease large subunit [Bacillales bacterium]|nr:exodeoxyribonuclease large subunit [Bacillales bacterium]